MGPSLTRNLLFLENRPKIALNQYSGTSLVIRSPMGLGKSDLNGEVTVLQGAKLHCGIQFGTGKG